MLTFRGVASSATLELWVLALQNAHEHDRAETPRKRRKTTAVQLLRVRMTADLPPELSSMLASLLTAMQKEAIQQITPGWSSETVNYAFDKLESFTLAIRDNEGRNLLAVEQLHDPVALNANKGVASLIQFGQVLQSQDTSLRVAAITCENDELAVDLDLLYEGRKLTRKAFAAFDSLCPSPLPPVPDTSIESFFHHLQPPISEHTIKETQPSALHSTLTPFQTQNLVWMLEREGHRIQSDGVVPNDLPPDTLPFGWEDYRGADSGQSVYINRLSGAISPFWTESMRQKHYMVHRGGILADEMGLGKTVSVIALILLHIHNELDSTHPRQDQHPDYVLSPATLIIVPETISGQWEAEINTHAPSLRVFRYYGVKDLDDKNSPITADHMKDYDIVLTDYNVLQAEIYRAKTQESRSRRHAPKYPVRQSFLTRVLWFRVVLDEVQMADSSTTNIGKMALQIPRWYSWGVSGTPMKKSKYDDLFGLFHFLDFLTQDVTKMAGIFSTPGGWSSFWDITKRIMRRNVKSSLEHQIRIPAQKRNIFNVIFSRIEQDYYNGVQDECRRHAHIDWLEQHQWHIDEEREPEDVVDTYRQNMQRLRDWFLTLRQACVHPSIGTTERSRIGRNAHTLEEVLDAMIRENRDGVDLFSFRIAESRLRCGGMHELMGELDAAISVYKEGTKIVQHNLDENRAHLDSVKKRLQDLEEPIKFKKENSDTKPNEDDEEKLKANRDKDKLQDEITAFTQRVLKWLGILHRFYFYTAGVHHKLEQENEEVEYYNKAAEVRREILQRPLERVTASRSELERYWEGFNPKDVQYTIGTEESNDSGTDSDSEYGVSPFDGAGIFNAISESLDLQLQHIIDWRENLRALLCSELVDNKNEETTGDEYEESLVTQEKVLMYHEAYEKALRQRTKLLLGVEPPKSTVSKPEKAEDDVQDENIKSLKDGINQQLESINAPQLPGGLSNLLTFIQHKRGIPAHQDTRKTSATEAVEKVVAMQRQLLEALENDYKKLSHLYNCRIEYFRALQEISDRVEDWKSRSPMQEISNLIEAEKKHQDGLDKLSARSRYLQHMAADRDDVNEQCIICKSPYERGVCTPCGHVFCHDCAMMWFRQHKRCPQCNTGVALQSLHYITPDADNFSMLDTSHVPKDSLEHKINACKIIGGRGAKIDSIVRHINFVRKNAGGKVLVFSQWNDTLALIEQGLKQNSIGYVDLYRGAPRMRRTSALDKFRNDPDTVVILLHSKSQSSGLTLTQAHTVIIVEPMINEALEMQAINRVHRIGQTDETAVFWYIVKGTIEQRIHEIHEARRTRRLRREQQLNLPVDEQTETVDLTKKGIESVTDNDLRLCFTSSDLNDLDE